MKTKKVPINVTADGCAFAIVTRYEARAYLKSMTGGVATIPPPASSNVQILGSWSPTSQLGGRVFSIEGIAPSIMAGTHGYGFGNILVYEDDSPEHD